jgi:putative flippase GtrA
MHTIIAKCATFIFVFICQYLLNRAISFRTLRKADA